MKCNKCNQSCDILELSLNNEFGWICTNCASVTNTDLNFFLDKKYQPDPGPLNQMGRAIHDPDSDEYQPFHS